MSLNSRSVVDDRGPKALSTMVLISDTCNINYFMALEECDLFSF